MSESLAHHPVVVRAPRHRLIDKTAPGLMQRAERTFEQERVASNKAPFQIGLIKLLAEGGDAEGAVIAVHPLLEDALEEAKRVDHETFPHHPRRVRQPLREVFRFGIQ